jgi:hypothetical protein
MRGRRTAPARVSRGRSLTEVIEVNRGRELVAAWSRTAGAGADLACRGWECGRAPLVPECLRRWRRRPRLVLETNEAGESGERERISTEQRKNREDAVMSNLLLLLPDGRRQWRGPLSRRRPGIGLPISAVDERSGRASKWQRGGLEKGVFRLYITR